MAIRDKLRSNAAHILQPGETIQAAFTGQTASPYLALISYWLVIIKNSYRVIIVTDKRIVVAKSGRWSTSAVKEIVGEFPRSTKVGPATGVWYKCDTLGERIYIHKRFHKDIAAADAQAATA